MSMLLWPIVCVAVYDLWHSSVFSAPLNAPSDGSDVIAGGSAFQTVAAATGKASGVNSAPGQRRHIRNTEPHTDPLAFFGY